MKYIYAIIGHQFMPQSEVRLQGVGTIVFAFTSKQKAMAQMIKIKELIESGEWFMESPNKPVEHKVEYCDTYDLNDCLDYLIMSMKVTHSNGTFTIYSLQRRKLNAGYDI